MRVVVCVCVCVIMSYVSCRVPCRLRFGPKRGEHVGATTPRSTLPSSTSNASLPTVFWLSSHWLRVREDELVKGSADFMLWTLNPYLTLESIPFHCDKDDDRQKRQNEEKTKGASQ